MKLACLQMDVLPSRPEENLIRAAALIEQAMAEKPDVLVLPEAWDISFLPKNVTDDLLDSDLHRVTEKIGALAKKHCVNIVAGSVSDRQDGKLYNTSCVFDREGNRIAVYRKTHLFSHTGENKRYDAGDSLCRFTLDGVRCGVIICYDVRFPELTRTLCLDGLDVLFVVCQWPKARTDMLQTLCRARAIENQIFVACCNACGTAGDRVCGGNSAIFGPFGESLAAAADTQTILYADCELDSLQELRNSFPVFRDRRPELYRL